MKYIKSKKILLKNHPDLNEKWLQEKIAEDPKILGLGKNIFLKDIERRQPSGGRLDLLLEDSDDKRFTVELQLGECDPDHIIRTVEYWDIERKRFPQYEHYAVIIAENITARFWNVINLFNRSIPLIAIQIDARQVGDSLTLNFIKVLDEVQYGSEEDAASEPADRSYWENQRSTPEILSCVDQLKRALDQFYPDLELKYNKIYIGLYRNHKVDNFINFVPHKNFVDLSFRKKNISQECISKLEAAGFIVREQSLWCGEYKISISGNQNDLKAKLPDLEQLFKEAGGFKGDVQTAA